MKRNLYFIIILLATCFAAVAQSEEFKFGKVDKADLEMEVYPLDSGASAVYLLDYGESILRSSDFKMLMTVHVRIKILNEEGLDWADLELRYIRGDGDITKLDAATHNLVNGKVVTRDVSKKEWIDEKVNDRFRVKKLSFPDAKVGSIIEYTYRREAGDIVDIPAWTFQTSIPVRHSEYIIQLSDYASYLPKFQGYIQPTYSNNTDGKYHIVMKDIPALTREPYVSTIENFRSKIEFEIKSFSAPGYKPQVFMENWNAINEELMESEGIGGALNNTGPLRRIYPEEKGWGNNKESLIEIYNYVRDHFTWNGYAAYRVVDSGKELWKEGEGDNADINVTLAQFLTKAGIKVSPVILSTRRHGYLNKYTPIASQFNYMIIQASVGDETILLDATDKFRPYNVLPERAMNGEGLVLNPYGPQWVDLSMNKEINSKAIVGDFEFNDDLELKGSMAIDFRSVAGSRLRASLYKEMEKKENSASEEPDETDEGDDETDDLDEFKTGEVENLKIENLENPEENLRLTYDFTTTEGINIIGDKIFMSPILIRHVTENPFKLEKRLYPVEFPSRLSDTYIFKISIPEGYEVEELPQPQILSLPNGGGKYMYNVGQVGEDVQVMVRLSLNKTQYASESYGNLKELFNLILSKQDQQIVFKEKSE
jgi:hypothetical protein